MGIPMYIESEWGHGDEANEVKDVPVEKVEEAVKEQLEKGNWVTVEKTDGSTETLTKTDIPADADDELDEEDKKLAEETKKSDAWKGVFGDKDKKKDDPPKIDVNSITSSKPVRGG